MTETSVPWILAVLLRDRRLVLMVIGVGWAVALLIALVQPRRYTVGFSFLPQSTSSQNAGRLAALAGQFGLALGALNGPPQPPQLFADLIETREVLAPVAKDSIPIGAGGATHMPITRFLGTAGGDTAVTVERTIEKLRREIISTSVAARTTNVVSVRVRTRSPQASFAIATDLLDGLNRYNRELRQGQASEERRFIEGRLEAARASLRQAEGALLRFLQTNRQFAGSPELWLERDRLSREVSQWQEVVSSLAQQTEEARIREVRDTPLITIIEEPALPVLPDPRGRVRILFVGTMAAACLGVMVVLLREGWRRRQAEVRDASYAQLAGEWRRLRVALTKRWS
jgi:uncharacterized protein involved in exopolysaccharide biosynthesis